MAQRPRRTPKPPPLSYWEEFVETDSWYLKKIVEDVPEEELHAALVDEDYAPGEGAMSGDETEGEEDETEGEADEDYAISEVHSERAKMKKKTTTTQTQTEPPSSHTSRTPTQTTRSTRVQRRGVWKRERRWRGCERHSGRRRAW